MFFQEPVRLVQDYYFKARQGDFLLYSSQVIDGIRYFRRMENTQNK
jgi:hypothetical protein